jgi:hypothetical protein
MLILIVTWARANLNFIYFLLSSLLLFGNQKDLKPMLISSEMIAKNENWNTNNFNK